MMWISGLLGIMIVWILLVFVVLFFFGVGMLFLLVISGVMELFLFFVGIVGVLVGGL